MSKNGEEFDSVAGKKQQRRQKVVRPRRAGGREAKADVADFDGGPASIHVGRRIDLRNSSADHRGAGMAARDGGEQRRGSTGVPAGEAGTLMRGSTGKRFTNAA